MKVKTKPVEFSIYELFVHDTPNVNHSINEVALEDVLNNTIHAVLHEMDIWDKSIGFMCENTSGLGRWVMDVEVTNEIPVLYPTKRVYSVEEVKEDLTGWIKAAVDKLDEMEFELK